jgi:hypothetical protein
MYLSMFSIVNPMLTGPIPPPTHLWKPRNIIILTLYQVSCRLIIVLQFTHVFINFMFYIVQIISIPLAPICNYRKLTIPLVQ